MTEPSPLHPQRQAWFSMLVDAETGSPKHSVLFTGCLLIASLLTFLMADSPGLTAASHRALFILMLAVLLWVTEAIPAFSVGFIVMGLEIVLLGNPNEGVFATTDKDWEHFVAVFGHPLIWLFFGGFVLAAGMERCALDRWLASRMLTRFGDRPAYVLLGVMTATFLLSMFMSNTATTAMMLAILTPLLSTLPRTDLFAKALLMGTAVAANLGGMGSLIGTPPNAIAVGALSELTPSRDVSFLRWLMLGLPPALVSMVIGWRYIYWLYPSHVKRIKLTIHDASCDEDGNAPRGWYMGVVSSTLIATIGLWLSSEWHGLPTAAVSFIPIVMFTTTGVLGVKEIRGLSYDVLFLMAGGLALGQMVTETGLSEWIVGRLPVDGISATALVIMMTYTTVMVSNVMSNTAAANFLIPLGITLASGFETNIAVGIAFGASSAMMLPVATPPNAMVYASGRCQSGDFAKIGAVMGLLAPAVGILWLGLVGPIVLGD